MFKQAILAMFVRDQSLRIKKKNYSEGQNGHERRGLKETLQHLHKLTLQHLRFNYGESFIIIIMTWHVKCCDIFCENWEPQRRTALKSSGCDSKLFTKHDSAYLGI